MSQAIFLKGDLRRHLLNLALPSIISLIVNFSFSLVDTLFVSQLGKGQLTAMGFVFPVFEFITCIGLGLGIATSAVLGQTVGRKRFRQAKQMASAAMILMILVAILVTIIGLCTIKPVFHMLGAKAISMPYIHSFMTVWYWGMLPFLLYFAFSFTARAYGLAKAVMIVGVLSALMNLALDPLFIFGYLGFPKLGIAGAAWAGLIARIFTMLLGVGYLVRKELICFCWSFKRIWLYWGRLRKIAIPAICTNLLPPISVTVTTILLARLSQEAVAAYGIATRIQWIAVIPMLAVSGSISAIIAQNYGAQQYKRAIHAMNITLVFSVIWGLFSAIVLGVFASVIVGVFHQDAYTSAIAKVFLYVVPISFMGWGAIMMINSSLNAMGRPKLSTLVSALRLLVIYIPLACFTMAWFGYKGVFLSLAFSNLFSGLIGWLIVRRLFRNCQQCD